MTFLIKGIHLISDTIYHHDTQASHQPDEPILLLMAYSAPSSRTAAAQS
jgi:hypothetical protein